MTELKLVLSRELTAQEALEQRWLMPNTPDSEVIWGGERGPGLVYIVAELTKTVTELAKTVADLTTVVSGNDGMQSQLKQLRADVDTMHTSNKERIDKLWQVGFPVMSAIALGVLGLIYRAVQIAQQGHL